MIARLLIKKSLFKIRVHASPSLELDYFLVTTIALKNLRYN